MKQITKKIGFDKDKMVVSIDQFANTSAASIPLCFVKKYGDEQTLKNLHSLICGFGVGLSWAAGFMDVNVESILPLVKTDEYFDDELYK